MHLPDETVETIHILIKTSTCCSTLHLHHLVLLIFKSILEGQFLSAFLHSWSLTGAYHLMKQITFKHWLWQALRIVTAHQQPLHDEFDSQHHINVSVWCTLLDKTKIHCVDCYPCFVYLDLEDFNWEHQKYLLSEGIQSSILCPTDY